MTEVAVCQCLCSINLSRTWWVCGGRHKKRAGFPAPLNRLKLRSRLEHEVDLEAHAAPVLPPKRLSVEAVQGASLRVCLRDVVEALIHQDCVIEAGLVGRNRRAIRSGRSTLGGVETRGADQVLSDEDRAMLIQAIQTLGSDPSLQPFVRLAQMEFLRHADVGLPANGRALVAHVTGDPVA